MNTDDDLGAELQVQLKGVTEFLIDSLFFLNSEGLMKVSGISQDNSLIAAETQSNLANLVVNDNRRLLTPRIKKEGP